MIPGNTCCTYASLQPQGTAHLLAPADQPVVQGKCSTCGKVWGWFRSFWKLRATKP